MKTLIAAALLIGGTASALAADKALILNDGEQVALKQIFDAAIRNSGLSQISRNAFVLGDKLDAAGVITEVKPQKDTPNETPPK